jgi:hypothetical protein
MADRVLVWYIDPPVGSVTTPQGPVYVMDQDYGAIRWTVVAKNPIPSNLNNLEIDIRVEGQSIFGEAPSIAFEDMDLGIEEGDEFFAPLAGNIDKDASVTCHIINTGGASGITVSLELEAMGETE